MHDVEELIRRRDLVYMLTWRELRIKYKQSVMGVLWAVLMPIFVVLAGTVVRFALAQASGRALDTMEIAAVTAKAAPWAFIVAAVRFGTTSLVSNATLITKIYLPRLVFPAASVLSQLIDYLVASVVGFAVMLALGVVPTLHLLWWPVLTLLLVLLATGLAIVLSAGSLFFRDVKYIVDVMITFAIFFTPVFFDASALGPWEPLVMLNPVAPVLEGFAAVAARGEPPPLAWLGYSLAIGLLTLVGALVVFHRVEPYFAESV